MNESVNQVLFGDPSTSLLATGLLEAGGKHVATRVRSFYSHSSPQLFPDD